MDSGANEASIGMMSRAECIELLATASVGRFGTVVAGRPVVLPVNFMLFEHDILVRTHPGTKLDVAVAGQLVAFEVDSFAVDGSQGWSVLIQGVAHEIVNEGELVKARAIELPTWAFNDRPERLVRVSTTSMTGRRFPVQPRE